MIAYEPPPKCKIQIEPGGRVFWFQMLHGAQTIQRGTVVARWRSGRLVNIKRDDGADVAIGDWVLHEEL